MNKEYNEKLIEIVNKLFEDSRYLLKEHSMAHVNIASDIAYLKGYVGVLKVEED